MATQRICSISGCSKPVYCRGHCATHYVTLRRKGVIPLVQTPAGKAAAFVEECLASNTDDCVLWPYGKDKGGYGSFTLNKRTTRAHRYICARVHGEAPHGLFACHSCGNASCVNPRHLRWGSQTENIADARQHGTLVCGERHSAAKLSERDVLEIRASRCTANELAERYSISLNYVKAVQNGRKWKHLPGAQIARRSPRKLP